MAKKLETYMQFKKRIEKEGYSIYREYSCGYVIYAPDGRSMGGPLEKIKKWLGE